MHAHLPEGMERIGGVGWNTRTVSLQTKKARELGPDPSYFLAVHL